MTEAQRTPEPTTASRRSSYARRHRGLLIFLLLLGAYRVLLATSSGHLHFPDEKLHIHAVHFVNHLAQGNLERAVFHVFKARGRPGFVPFESVPTVARIALRKLGLVSPDSPHSYDVYAIYNVLFSLSLTVLFYHIVLLTVGAGGGAEARHEPGRRVEALLWTVVYGLLCNSNLYTRHLLPYDFALFLFMAGLWLAFRGVESSPLSNRAAIACGLLGAAGFATYPGYYWLVLILATAVLGCGGMRRLLIYFVSAGGVLGALELAARLSGRSYLLGGRRLYDSFRTAIQGSHQEGFTFPWRYLAEVEGAIGYVLLILAAACVVLILPRRRHALRPLLVVAIVGYLFHATMVAVFERLMWYGRLVHMYVPFMVLAGALAVRHVPHPRWRRVVMGVVGVASIGSFLSYAPALLRVGYPKDFARAHLPEVEEATACSTMETGDRDDIDWDACPVVVVNADDILCPVEGELLPLAPPANRRVTATAPHLSSFRAYPFEGCDPTSRAKLREWNLQMRAYQSVDEVASAPRGGRGTSKNVRP